MGPKDTKLIVQTSQKILAAIFVAAVIHKSGEVTLPLYEMFVGERTNLTRGQDGFEHSAIYAVGHALVAYRNEMNVFGLDVVPRKETLSSIVYECDDSLLDQEYLKKRCQLSLGGLAAMQLKFGFYDSGCLRGLQKARDLIHENIHVFDPETNEELLMADQIEITKDMLKTDIKLLENISQVLLTTKVLLGKQFEFLMLFFEGKVDEALTHEAITEDDKEKMLIALKNTGLITENAYDQYRAIISPKIELVD